MIFQQMIPDPSRIVLWEDPVKETWAYNDLDSGSLINAGSPMNTSLKTRKGCFEGTAGGYWAAIYICIQLGGPMQIYEIDAVDDLQI